ncbi:MAG: hypothetical protein DCC68_23080 [Planctomycetota bacterium]|nr:MAG: hypothetical protein DCC68_23080 [Planctomycetota bacterium]
MNARHWISLLSFGAALFAAAPVRADLVTAENLLVSLSADTAGVGDPSWANAGSLGGAFAATNPLGVKLNLFGPNDNIGVEFDGLVGGDAFQGPIAPGGITGAGTRSIEVWAYNPGVVGEETLVAWGRRGGPDGTNMSFNYGNHPSFGAVGHWGGAADLGWGGIVTPTAGQWHHLVYTYDGTTARVYSDGQVRNGRLVPLNTHAGFTINVGAQNVNPTPNLEGGLRLSGAIGAVRVHDGVLSAADILNNYNQERDVYGAPPAPSIYVPTPAQLTAGPKHRYEFNGNADDSIGGAHGTLSNPQGLATYHDGLLDLRNANNNVASTNAATQGAYVDLPNGIISSLGNQATFEFWINVETNYNWDRVFDFGRSDVGEDNSGGGPNSEYIFATTMNGASQTLRVAHRSENEPPAAGYGENIVDAFGRLSTNVDHQLVVVWDEVAGMQTVYLDGQALDVASSPIRSTITLAAMQDLNNWLGRSQWPDPMFDGTYDEVRIYDYALSPDQVLGNYQAGPNVVNVVPEPSTLSLAALGAGLAVLRFCRRVRKA